MNKDKVIETAEPIKTPYSKVIYRKKPPAPVNEDGLRLTKSGKVDKRQATSKKNLEKSENYQKIQNTIEKVKQQSYEDIEESDDEDDEESDDDPEYEIENIPMRKKVIEDEIKNVVEDVKKKVSFEAEEKINKEKSATEKYLQEQEELRKKMDSELFLLKEENKKLKNNFHFNEHLNRISHMSRNVKLSF